MKTYIYFMLTFLLTACKKDAPINNTIYNHLGIPFTLKVSECTTLMPYEPSKNKEDSILTMCFKKVVNDGRCYKSDCYKCYGSSADISVSLIHQNDTTNLTLSILGCSYNSEPVCDEHYYYRKDTLGYRICLLRLDPYPDYNNTPINPSDYSAKLKIIKL